MKKRIFEAVTIFAVLIVAVVLINVTMSYFSDNPVAYEIDGEYIAVGDGTVELYLITEDGLENLIYLTRMTTLTISPYKYERYISVNTTSEDDVATLKEWAEENFGSYTDVCDISFLDGITWLNKLYLDGCAVTDISVIECMSELSELSLKDTSVYDISVLSSLENLAVLDIRGANIDNLEILLECKSLATVYADEGQISDDIISQGQFTVEVG